MKNLLRSLFLVAVAILLLGGQAKGAVIKWLHYTETTGYNHNTKSQSFQMHEDFAFTLSMLDPNNTYIVIDDDNGNEFNTLANLQTYAVVIFSNTSGDNGLSQTQRTNFENYMAGGGNYVGYHAASDTYRHSDCNGGSKGTWDYYAEQVAGCSVRQSPNHTSNNKVANIMGVNAASVPVSLFGGYTIFGASYNPLPVVWNKQEEYYYWHDGNGNVNNGQGGYLSSNFIPYLQVENTGGNGYDIARMWAQFSNHAGGGCCVYFAGGHDRKNFTGASMNGSSPDSLFRHMAFSAFISMPCSTSPNLPVDKDALSKDPAAPLAGTNLIFHDEATNQIHMQNFHEKAVEVVTEVKINTLLGVTYQVIPLDLSTDQTIQIPSYLPAGTYYLILKGSIRTKKFIVR